MTSERNPLTNWRWWVMLIPTLAIALLATAFVLIEQLGDLCGKANGWLSSVLREVIVPWTWRKRHD